MFLINKSLDYNTIICTVTENTTVNSAVYLLVVHSEFSNKTFSVLLGSNLSAYKARYDEFVIADSFYKDIEDGICKYSIYQQDDIVGQPVESGFIKFFTPDTSILYLSVDAPENEDDYIVFNQ